jgi:hypothetical protein
VTSICDHDGLADVPEEACGGSQDRVSTKRKIGPLFLACWSKEAGDHMSTWATPEVGWVDEA